MEILVGVCRRTGHVVRVLHTKGRIRMRGAHGGGVPGRLDAGGPGQEAGMVCFGLSRNG